MSNDKYHADIRRLLEQHGAMGVNQISKELNVPLSTMQKYLDKDQNYFKKNHARKWVLPEISASEEMSVVSSNYSDVINSQIMGMQALIETLMSQFRATLSLIEANKGTSASVAGIMPDIHPEILKLNKAAKDMHTVFSKYISKCPDEYQELLKNVDLYRLIKERGTIYMNSEFSTEITSLFLERTVDLSNEVVAVLKEYQKEIRL
ncbi:MAG: virulence-associated protein VapD [Candidatus Nitrosomirales archaeon]|jgi:virulence-associated protein VapD